MENEKKNLYTFLFTSSLYIFASISKLNSKFLPVGLICRNTCWHDLYTHGFDVYTWGMFCALTDISISVGAMFIPAGKFFLAAAMQFFTCGNWEGICTKEHKFLYHGCCFQQWYLNCCTSLIEKWLQITWLW